MENVFKDILLNLEQNVFQVSGLLCHKRTEVHVMHAPTTPRAQRQLLLLTARRTRHFLPPARQEKESYHVCTVQQLIKCSWFSNKSNSTTILHLFNSQVTMYFVTLLTLWSWFTSHVTSQRHVVSSSQRHPGVGFRDD